MTPAATKRRRRPAADRPSRPAAKKRRRRGGARAATPPRATPTTAADEAAPRSGAASSRAKRRHSKHKPRVYRDCLQRCVYCGTTLSLADTTLDHVHPCDLGGPDLPANLVAACRDCNGAKAADPLDRFLAAHPECAGPFVLFARAADPAYRALAATHCDTPYHDDLIQRLPRTLRTRPWLQQLAAALPALLAAA